jgi:four helix bundle protein
MMERTQSGTARRREWDGGRRHEGNEARGGESKPARSVEELVAWQKAHRLVLDVYRATEPFPRHETFGLTAQLRRASVSVAANIAEGFRKSGRTDKVYLMNLARGSAEEARYYLILAKDLGYADTAPLLEKLEEVGRLLGGYVRALTKGAEGRPSGS